MLTATPVHPEGPRYAAPLLFLPGLWSRPRVWRAAASYLGHRGWQGGILDLLSLRGGSRARAAAVVEHVRALPVPPVLLAHDAGATVALAVAATVPLHALVLVAPLLPDAATTHAFVWSRGLSWALVTGRRRPLPGGTAAEVVLGEMSAAERAALAPEDPRILGELARAAPLPRPAAMPPTLVVAGTRDPLLSPAAAEAFARGLGADRLEVEGGHWLIAGPAWQACAGTVHRWLIQRGGVPLLELYEEAMAERDEEEGPA